MNLKTILRFRIGSIPSWGVLFVLVLPLLNFHKAGASPTKLSEKLLPEEPLRIVKGIITNTEGEPLIGVNIRLKSGENEGQVSNLDGIYSIEIPRDRDAVLVFSYVGFKDKEVIINREEGAEKILNIQMEIDPQRLNELVVIGYDEVERKDLTGAIAGITNKEIKQSQALSIQEVMQGRIPGVQISSSSGEPGAAMDVIIRGAGSINGSNAPLYVIDGIPFEATSEDIASESMDQTGMAYSKFNPLASLNPSDIESVSVLKDASATAIYGARGANGVVIITTNSGSPGALRFEYNGTVQVSELIKRLKVLSPDEYIDFRRTLDPHSSLFYTDSNHDGRYDEEDEPADPYRFPLHDWQDEVLRLGIAHSHGLSFSGGNENTTFTGSLSYLNDNSILNSSGLDRYTGNFSVNHKLGKFRFSSRLNLSQTVNKGAKDLSIMRGIVESRPIEYYNPNVDVEDGEFISPLTRITESDVNTTTLTARYYASLGYDITKDLVLKNNFGGYLISSKGKEFYGKKTIVGRSTLGMSNLRQRNSQYFNNTTQLFYTKRINKDHVLRGMLAIEYSKQVNEDMFFRISGYSDETTGINDISKGETIEIHNSSRDKRNLLSYFGRLNYNLVGKHLFTATFRADGSDRFGSGNRFGYFPSFAYAWEMSKEQLIEDLNLFSNLKLRLSYGETGNAQIPAFQYLASLENSFYRGRLGLAPSSLANPNLKWESVTQYNAGLDMGFLDDKIGLNVDVYFKKTDNLLLLTELPKISGYATQWRNFGRIDNKGIEVSINTVNIQTENFLWTTDFNISANRNEVRRMGNMGYITVNLAGETIHEIGRVAVGGELGEFYGFELDGMYQINDFEWQNDSDPDIPHSEREYSLKEGEVDFPGAVLIPGSFKFKDLNGDNVIDLDNDRKVIGHSYPRFYGGLNNTINFKNLDFNVFFQWSYGNQLFNSSRLRLEGRNYTSLTNVLADFWNNKWSPENPTNEFSEVQGKNPLALFANSYYVEDASWLRLKNVSIGYTFKNSFFDRIGIRDFRIYLTGTNLLTFTRYSGWDPEVNNNNPLIPGVDRGTYPRQKSLLFGINFSF